MKRNAYIYSDIKDVWILENLFHSYLERDYEIKGIVDEKIGCNFLLGIPLVKPEVLYGNDDVVIITYDYSRILKEIGAVKRDKEIHVFAFFFHRIVSAKTARFFNTIKRLLKKIGLNWNVFNKLFRPFIIRRQSLEFYKTTLADKKVIIYGEDLHEVKKIDKMLLRATGKEAVFYIGDTGKSFEKYKKFDDIFLLDVSEMFFLISHDGNDVMRRIGKLISAGIERSHVIMDWAEMPYIGPKIFDTYDVTLGYSREDDIGGFTIFGDKDAKYKIVALGGSTTDATFGNLKSWPEFLFDMILKVKKDVCVFAGGMGGYNSTQEVLKLLRDVIPLEPDLVISYSGTNDIEECLDNWVEEHPFVWKYSKNIFQKVLKKGILNKYSLTSSKMKKIGFGYPDRRSPARRWYDNVRTIHSVCTEFGITYRCFLQPHRNGGGVYHRCKRVVPEQ